jgi:hypothetical protein
LTFLSLGEQQQKGAFLNVSAIRSLSTRSSKKVPLKFKEDIAGDIRKRDCDS